MEVVHKVNVGHMEAEVFLELTVLLDQRVGITILIFRIYLIQSVRVKYYAYVLQVDLEILDLQDYEVRKEQKEILAHQVPLEDKVAEVRRESQVLLAKLVDLEIEEHLELMESLEIRVHKVFKVFLVLWAHRVHKAEL